MLNTLLSVLRNKLGINQNTHSVEHLSHRLEFVAAFMNLTWPEKLEVDKTLMHSALKKLKEDQNVDSYNTAIHKNDLMFANSVYNHRQDMEKAIFSYFKIGIRNLRSLEAVLTSRNLSPKKILDFGSGYGRVSRFFPSVFPNAEVTVTEVKSQCLEFQADNFGYKTIHHSQDANSFKGETYDLIFALSVFTHLPQSSFEAWFYKLTESLNTGGALVFTFNDSADPNHKKHGNKNFVYKTVSEDTTFSFVADSIKDDQDYGSTFVSRKYLKQLVDSNKLDFEFLDKKVAPQQDALILIKK